MSYYADKFGVHHPWCNFYGCKPVEECRMCKDFFERFPLDEKGHIDIGQHFPNAQVINGK